MKFEDLLDIHCKGKYPREFGHKTKRSFLRNEYAPNAKVLTRMCEFFNYRDCYVSVYSFTAPVTPGEMWDRNSAIVDRLYLDLDYEGNLTIPLKEARKIVSWYLKQFGVYPLIYFTGCRGFAIYFDFKPLKFKDATTAKEHLRAIASLIVDILKLRTVDFQVIEIARISRIPLTINTKTGYYCIPLNPKKLDILTAQDIIHMSKMKIYHVPEVEEAPDFHEVVEKAHILIENTRPPPPDHNNHTTSNAEVDNHPDLRRLIQMILKAPNAHLVGKRYLNRAIYYTKVLVEKGSLSKDPLIVEIHSKSKWYKELAKKGKANKGAIEQLARVSFVLMLKTLGLTDEQIHEIFKHAEDYDYKKTQYFIEYNSKRLPEYLNSSYFLKTKALNP
jgi:hypothetical protein